MKKPTKNIHTIDMIFPLIFLVLFSFCALSVVLEGTKIYEKTTKGLQKNYTLRTAVSYLQEKIRENNDTGQIELLAKGSEPEQVLVLYSERKGQRYATYIYVDGGMLKELFTKKTNVPDYGAGQELLSLDSFQVIRETAELLKIQVTKGDDGETIYIRTYTNAMAEGTQ